MGKEQQGSPATLGAVLYARSRPPVSEREWARLVRLIAAGDQAALHALYEMSHRVVFTLSLRITASPETAEEITLDVFHDIWRRASRYDSANGTVLGWIMNQTRSRAIDRLRFDGRKKRKDGSAAEAQVDPAADPHDVLELREQIASVTAALAVLAPEERDALQKTYLEELTHAEAAKRLGLPLGTIKTRIRSGLHKLRRALGAQEGTP